MIHVSDKENTHKFKKYIPGSSISSTEPNILHNILNVHYDARTVNLATFSRTTRELMKTLNSLTDIARTKQVLTGFYCFKV